MDSELLFACESGDLYRLITYFKTSPQIHSDEDGWSALHHACKYDRPAIVRYLIRKGLPVNQEDEDGWTPLHVAVHFGWTNIVCILLKMGAKPDIADKCGWTPLHMTAERNNPRIASLLIANGASIRKREYTRNQTAYKIAKSKGYETLALILEE